ncbi:MAG: 5'/3'-nucleotidase SurE [Acidobacteriota bacterium]|nr:5'/3'-nucleotidase SurE [Acidobacteriota bacterium]
MRVLVTNDDGVTSPGLAVLAEAARGCGMEVTVVAPSEDASGTGAAMTVRVDEGVVTLAEVTGADGRPAGSLPGGPAFIVRAAMFGAFGPPPDLVLSGINQGVNTGKAILHSGTVGAALTAANYGRRALALSSAAGSDCSADVESVDLEVVATIVKWVRDTPPGTVLNVNLPAASDGRRAALDRVRVTSLAGVGTVQGRVTDARGSVPVVFNDEGGTPESGTDVAALAAGYISVTAIRSIVEDSRVDLTRIVG